MISVRNIKVNTVSDKIMIDVSAATGYLITGLRLWTEDTFKDATRSKVLDYKLTNLSNQEVFEINPIEAGVSTFSGIYFLEITTNEPNIDPCCPNPVPLLVVVTNLTGYYKCITEMVLKTSFCNSNLFDREVCDDSGINKAMSAELILQTIIKSLELGQFIESIDLLKKLKRICAKCSNCFSPSVNSNCTTCKTYKYN